MVGNDYDFIDLYDLLTDAKEKAHITFDYDGVKNRLDIFPDKGETIYQYGDKWFHGSEDFLEKARIRGARITSVLDLISNIRVSDVE